MRQQTAPTAGVPVEASRTRRSHGMCRGIVLAGAILTTTGLTTGAAGAVPVDLGSTVGHLAAAPAERSARLGAELSSLVDHRPGLHLPAALPIPGRASSVVRPAFPSATAVPGWVRAGGIGMLAGELHSAAVRSATVRRAAEAAVEADKRAAEAEAQRQAVEAQRQAAEAQAAATQAAADAEAAAAAAAAENQRLATEQAGFERQSAPAPAAPTTSAPAGRPQRSEEAAAPAPAPAPAPAAAAPAPPAPTPPAALSVATAPAPGSAEEAAAARLFDLANAERAAVGLPALRWNAGLRDAALGQANLIAAAGSLFHQDLYPLLGMGWTAASENVGRGPGADSVHQAFVASSAHFANLTCDSYTDTGVGVVVGGDGRLYVGVVFAG